MASLLDELKVLTTATVGLTKSEQKQAPDFTHDAPVFIVFTICFFLLNWGVRLLVVAPVVRHTLITQKVSRRPGASEDKVVKFCQCCMEAIFYGGFTILGLIVVPNQEWVWPSQRWWAGFADGGHELMRPDLRGYYLMYIARYVGCCISVLLEPKRKDFIAMMVHHVVTVAVCIISYVYGWNRIGVVVMLLFDPADVPLHCAKMLKYTADATGRRFFQMLADRCFETFAAVFFVTRLVCHGYVCWSASVEGPRVIPNAGGPAGWTCIALLYVLLALQIYWFGLIAQVAIKLIKNGSVEDVRSSDDEDESASGQKMKRHED